MEKTSTKRPVTLITGLLGSGKTTLLQTLIDQRPANQRWAFLINDFGPMGLDEAFLDTQNDFIKDGLIENVGGGCLCCSAQHGYRQALNRLAQHSFDHLWIEASGLAHPARILDLFREKSFQPFFTFHQTLAVVTPEQLNDAFWHRSESVRDLVHLADTVVLTRTELVDDIRMESAWKRLQALYPAKQTILCPTFQHQRYHFHPPIQSETWRPAAEEKLSSPAFISFHSLEETEHRPQSETRSMPVEPILPYVIETHWLTGDSHVLGWRWQADALFNRTHLRTFFNTYGHLIQRAKGVLRTGHEWQRLDWAHGEFRLQPLAWRQDSRLELLLAELSDSERKALEKVLRQTYIGRPK